MTRRWKERINHGHGMEQEAHSLAVTPIKTLHGFYISLHQIETCDKCLEIDMSFLALRGAGLQGSLDARRLLLNSLMQLFRIVQPNLPSLSSIYTVQSETHSIHSDLPCSQVLGVQLHAVYDHALVERAAFICARSSTCCSLQVC